MNPNEEGSCEVVEPVVPYRMSTLTFLLHVNVNTVCVCYSQCVCCKSCNYSEHSEMMTTNKGPQHAPLESVSMLIFLLILIFFSKVSLLGDSHSLISYVALVHCILPLRLSEQFSPENPDRQMHSPGSLHTPPIGAAMERHMQGRIT